MTEYTIFERGDDNWSAYVSDLPGYVAAAATHEETEAFIREAIALHLDLLRTDGDPIPEPCTEAARISIPA